MMSKLLREPLLHFLVGGALLFLLYGRVAGDGAGERSDRIVVSEARVASLAATFERTWMRPPSSDELQGLIDEFVTEEILYRQALALELDRDDLVVRRRLRQKMDFLNEGLTERAATEEELQAFLDANPERFREPALVSFRQAFVNPERAGLPAEERAEALLTRLRTDGITGAGDEALGDPTLLPESLQTATPRQVSGHFGEALSEALASAPEGVWTGPLASSFGLHLVYVSARDPARTPSLDESRRNVEREWAADRRREAKQKFYDGLRAGYEVEILMPDPAADTKVSRAR